MRQIVCHLVAVGLIVSLAGGPVCAQSEARVTIKGDHLRRQGKAFRVQGIEYSPWEPGSGPGNGHWPGPEKIAKDLESIQSLGCNVVSVVDPPQRFFTVVEKTPLLVIYTMGIFQSQWERIGEEDFQAREEILWQNFERYKDNPKIILWVLGREITPVAQQKYGPKIVDWLKNTSQKMHRENPDVLVSHANWPPTRALALDFLDIACFDLYPGWPPEVSLRGFGKYIQEELKPIADGRPLLITEFGANSVEVSRKSQGDILYKCWLELLDADACGAVIFSYMDEWWKNYDNPISTNSWWARKPAPKDADTHDRDPEEHYGLVEADRTAKPAFYAVQAMYLETPLPVIEKSRTQLIVRITAGFVIFLILIKLASVIMTRKSKLPDTKKQETTT